MESLNLVLLALAVPTMVGFICRLALLDIRQHRPVVVVMHVGMAMSVAWSGYHAFNGAGDLGDWAAVVAAMAWLKLSIRTWRHGVPEKFCTKPKEIHPVDLTKVAGGTRPSNQEF